MAFETEILQWYGKHKKDFPWRTDPPDPYFVFVSEFMLQQTTTLSVVPYFQKFTKRFPSFEALAQASIEEIMFYWQGLGYYRRATYLHKSAQIIVKTQSLNDPKFLKQLPGVGDYTCNAILAIAFNKNVLPIDGNIKRVFARYFGIDTPYIQIDKAIKKIPIYFKRPSDLCQGIMDFANTICTAKSPRCDQCPLSSDCIAFQNKITHILPQKKERLIKKQLYTNGLIYYSKDQQVLLKKHAPESLLGNLWNIPFTPFNKFINPQNGILIGMIKHAFTHIDLHVNIYCVNHTLEGTLVKLDQMDNYPQSTLTKKCLKLFLQHK